MRPTASTCGLAPSSEGSASTRAERRSSDGPPRRVVEPVVDVRQEGAGPLDAEQRDEREARRRDLGAARSSGTWRYAVVNQRGWRSGFSWRPSRRSASHDLLEPRLGEQVLEAARRRRTANREIRRGAREGHRGRSTPQRLRERPRAGRPPRAGGRAGRARAPRRRSRRRTAAPARRLARVAPRRRPAPGRGAARPDRRARRRRRARPATPRTHRAAADVEHARGRRRQEPLEQLLRADELEPAPARQPPRLLPAVVVHLISGSTGPARYRTVGAASLTTTITA